MRAAEWPDTSESIDFARLGSSRKMSSILRNSTRSCRFNHCALAICTARHHARVSVMSYSTLTSLPPEVLLEIAACLTHLTRNTDLANLSLVSQRLRPIAQEWLLKAPRFSLKYIDRYMYELAQQPKLWAQVYKLEIWSKNEGRVKYDERGLSIKEYISTKAATGIPSGSLETVCKVVMERYVCSEAMEAEWRAALQDDVVPALFTVLLCMLSKLKELTLGNAWSMDFPIFAHLLSPNTRALPYIPTAWSSSYSAPAVITRIWQLKVLELPADMTAMYFCLAYRR